MNIFQKIALWRDVNEVRGALKEVKMEKVKAGIKTSEFWLALLAAIIPVVNQHLGLNLPTEAVLAVAGIAIAYIFGRSLVKKNV